MFALNSLTNSKGADFKIWLAPFSLTICTPEHSVQPAQSLILIKPFADFMQHFRSWANNEDWQDCTDRQFHWVHVIISFISISFSFFSNQVLWGFIFSFFFPRIFAHIKPTDKCYSGNNSPGRKSTDLPQPEWMTQEVIFEEGLISKFKTNFCVGPSNMMCLKPVAFLTPHTIHTVEPDCLLLFQACIRFLYAA